MTARGLTVLLTLALCAPQLFAHSSLQSGDSRMTGSPLDGANNTCANNCHSATSVVNPAAGINFTGISGTTYIPGTTYSLTLALTGASGRNGFEITAENASAKVGTFTSGANSSLLNNNWVGQSNDSVNAWSFSYKAPAAGAGQICFYVIVMENSSNQRGPEWLNHYCYSEAAAAAPTITTQPTNQTVTEGQKATFSVVATGTGLTYQWQKAPSGSSTFANISGATSASYTTPATTMAGDNGSSFKCVMTNSGGSVTSSAATLTVNAAPPAITVQPTNQSVTAGQTATFSVTATGSAPLSYQWQSAPSGSATFTNIMGAASNTYTTPATALSDSGTSFRCVVTNTASNVTSAAAVLTVTAAAVPPAITTPPQSQTVSAGQTATFSVTASGTAPLSYQWKKAPSGSATFTAIAGATSASYTTPATTLADNGSQFQCVVTNSAGSATSSAAVLTVGAAPPAITISPANQSVGVGQTATFSVTASGTAPLNYQWQSAPAGSAAFTNISGATASSYTTPAAALTDNGASFRCVVSNSAGTATSNAAMWTVNAPGTPIITQDPASISVSAGQSASFTVMVSNPADPTLTYTWYRDGVAIAPASNGKPTYTLPSATPSDSGALFYCICANTSGSSTSGTAQLFVTQAMVVPQIANLQPYMSLGDTLQVGTAYSVPVSFYWTFTQTGTAPGFGAIRYAAPGLIAPVTAQTSSYSSALHLGTLGLVPGGYQIGLTAADSSGNISPPMTANVVFLPADLGSVRVYPNPWRADRDSGRVVTFDRLTANSTVKIFTVSGHQAKSISGATGSALWDLTNDSGDPVASGLYLYLVTDDTGQKARGKLAIIK